MCVFIYSAFVKVIRWHQSGVRPLPEPMITLITDTCMCYQASQNYVRWVPGLIYGPHFEWLVQERRNSIVLTMELRLSCTNLLIYPFVAVLRCAISDLIRVLVIETNVFVIFPMQTLKYLWTSFLIEYTAISMVYLTRVDSSM